MQFTYNQLPRGPVTNSAPQALAPMSVPNQAAYNGSLTNNPSMKTLVDALRKAARDKLKASTGLGSAMTDAADANATGSGFVSPIATSALA